MQAVILAGGLATRLGPLAQDCPKSMIRIEDKPFLEYQLELLEKKGVREVVLCVGHLGDPIESYFKDGSRLHLKIRYSREGEPLLGTGGAVRNAFSVLEDAFFVMYGDSYLMLDYAAIWRAFQAGAQEGLMVVFHNESRYDRSNVRLEKGYVTHYGFDKDAVYIDEGISVLRKEFFRSFPEGRAFALGEVFQKLIQGRQLRAYETSQRFYEIGSPSGLEEFRMFMKNQSQIKEKTS